MKKLLIVTTIATVTLFAGNIDIVTMKANPKRVSPTSSQVILSYNTSISKIIKSVVNISTTKNITTTNNQLNQMLKNPFFKDFFGHNLPQTKPQQHKAHSLGSGVIISKDGYIVTNNHVVENADEIIVTLTGDTKEYKAKVIGTDPRTDLAVIKIDDKSLEEAKFANSDYLKEGDIVFAIGNPFGVGESVTQGIVSALNKHGIGLNQYENFIQTDASINPGNSGGALVDSRGALIGINSAILSRSGGNNGIGFSIPSNMVKDVATRLIRNGKIERGYIGVSISDLTKDLKEIYASQIGALILNVEKNSPADKAGLKRGDLIIRIDDDKIKDANDLKNIVGAKKPAQVVKVKFERNNKINNTTITLANMDKSSLLNNKNTNYIDGLNLEELNDKLRLKYKIPNNIKGVLIIGVKANSKAYKYGFIPGDIIEQIDQSNISSIEDMANALKRNKNKKVVYVNRNGYHKAIVIK